MNSTGNVESKLSSFNNNYNIKKLYLSVHSGPIFATHFLNKFSMVDGLAGTNMTIYLNNLLYLWAPSIRLGFGTKRRVNISHLI